MAKWQICICLKMSVVYIYKCHILCSMKEYSSFFFKYVCIYPGLKSETLHFAPYFNKEFIIHLVLQYLCVLSLHLLDIWLPSPSNQQNTKWPPKCKENPRILYELFSKKAKCIYLYCLWYKMTFIWPSNPRRPPFFYIFTATIITPLKDNDDDNDDANDNMIYLL